MGTSRHSFSQDRLTAKLGPVLLGIHIVALPLYPHMPLPVLLTVVLFSIWTLLIILGRVVQPGRLTMVLLACIVVAVLVLSFGTIFGQQPGSAMLLLLSFLKLFEMKSTRDIAIVIFMGFFLIASNFFYSQSLMIAIYVFVVVVYLTSVLIVFSDRLGTTRFIVRVQHSLQMILLAVPLMLILFVLFPRVPGPLWGLPKDTQTAATGLSEAMSPGSISRLVSSGEVAFRVKFVGKPPPRSERYWRGLVLSKYDGKTWRSDNAPSDTYPRLSRSEGADTSYDYTVMLEPHHRRWLFALESIVEYGDEQNLTRELQLLSTDPITDVTRYSLRSDTTVRNLGLFESERGKNLDLPAARNRQTVEFARALFGDSNQDGSTYVKKVLQHFGEQAFFYTLTPPLLGINAMDDFLFRTRRGFCEHYASAFVYLMRAVSIPARVVVGYQGGAMHPFDDYMIVRQSDAHAWAEVWLEGQGWVRIDPTAAVSPTRIQNGIASAGLERDLLPSILVSENAWFQRARLLWDSFHNNWNLWVIGFDQQRQQRLLALLGMKDVSSSELVIGLVLVMTCAVGLLAWWVLLSEPARQRDVVRAYYDKFCRKLQKAGVSYHPHECAGELMARASRVLPARERELAMITADYQCLRYGDDPDPRRRERFIRAIRRFRPS